MSNFTEYLKEKECDKRRVCIALYAENKYICRMKGFLLKERRGYESF